MEKKLPEQPQGSLETAIHGQYDINVKAVLTEAWQLTLSCRRPFNLGLLFILAIGTIVSILTSYYMGGVQAIIENPDLTFLLNILITILIWPLLAGVEMMGVLHASGFTIHTRLIFGYLKRGSWVAVCALLTSILISIGIQLLIVPGIFLAVVFSLAIPLVVERNLSPWQAMVVSIKALRHSWLKLLAIYSLLSLALIVFLIPVYFSLHSTLFILSLVLLFFALSYLAPMFYHAKGILYRNIFGLSIYQCDDHNQSVTPKDDIFIA